MLIWRWFGKAGVWEGVAGWGREWFPPTPNTLVHGAEWVSWRCMVGGVPAPPLLDTGNAVVILQFQNFNIYPPKYMKLGSNSAARAGDTPEKLREK